MCLENDCKALCCIRLEKMRTCVCCIISEWFKSPHVPSRDLSLIASPSEQHLQFKQPTLVPSAARLGHISWASTAATCCSFKAAARLAHAKTSYRVGKQTAVTQRKLCFNVIRGWSTSLQHCNDAVFPCLSDNGLMALISRP